MATTTAVAPPKSETKPVVKQAEPAKKMQRLMFGPELIGCPVQWFQTGDPTEKPMMAVCIDAHGRDKITIRVTDFGGDRQFTRRNCPHISDPDLTARKTPIPGPPLGAWDFAPWQVPEAYRQVDSIKYRIVLLFQNHAYNASQIASALKGDWTEAKVQEVLDEHATKP